jgi:anaerobic magnesium-protoporphyrin IX monomethyl ester cyclase
MSTDCLIIGFHEQSFPGYVELVKSMGADSGAFQDLALAYIDFEGKPMRSMDMLNRFYFEGKAEPERPFSNVDFMWPVVMYLATFLDRRGFSWDYINLFHREKEKLKRKLLSDDILTIAISTTLYVEPQPIIEIISFIRQHNDRAKIVVGGPYISNQAKVSEVEEVKGLYKFLGADVYVDSQEGEQALVDLLRALKSGGSLDEVDNIAYRQGDSYTITRRSAESNSLEENMVDYRLFPKEEIGEMVSLRTAKSCPFSCAFCGFPQRAGQYTYMGLEAVERELNALKELGVTTLTFLDDTFNVPKKRFREILQMMIRNGYGFKWNSFYRSDHGDAETIRLMGESGCEGTFLGVESGSDKMLKLMNKTSRRINYQQAIPLMREAGIASYASLIFGFPGETYETVQESLGLIEEARPDFFRAQLWYADPTTPIWKRREEVGLKGSAFNWEHSTMDSATACDLIDKAFLSVEGSVWQPQFGFEQWSVFYLQRRGMALDRMKTFLRCFNALIRERLLNPGLTEHDPRLIEALRVACRFDDPRQPDLGPVAELDGSRYKAAQEFWLRELPPGPVESSLEQLFAGGPVEGWAVAEVPVSGESLETALRTCGAELPVLLPAVLSTLLLRLSARQELVMVVDFPEGASPLVLRPHWEIPFRDLVGETEAALAGAAEHRRYGFPLLTNALRLAELGRSRPVLDVGCAVLEPAPGGRPFEELARTRPEVEAGLCLILGVAARGAETGLRFWYRRGKLHGDTVEALGVRLAEILTQVAAEPDVRLEALELSGAGPVRKPRRAVESHSTAVFDF